MMLKRTVIILLLITGAILTQSVLALSLPTGEGTEYFGVRDYSPFGTDASIEFAVYNNGGQDLIDEGYSLAFSDPKEYVYVYKIFYDDDLEFAPEFFSIYGIGENAIGSDSTNYIGHSDDSPMSLPDRGAEPASEAFVLDENEVDDDGKYFSSAYWDFRTVDGDNPWEDNDHSYLLMITSDHPWKAGSYDFNAPSNTTIPIPNPEPCTAALLAVGGALLLRKRNRKI